MRPFWAKERGRRRLFGGLHRRDSHRCGYVERSFTGPSPSPAHSLIQAEGERGGRVCGGGEGKGPPYSGGASQEAGVGAAGEAKARSERSERGTLG